MTDMPVHDSSDAGSTLVCICGFRYVDLPNDPRRVSSHDDEVRDVLGHDASRTDRDALPDGHPRKHNDVPSKPTILAHLYRFPTLWPTGSVSDEGIQRMVPAIERAIRANEGTSPDFNGARIYPGAVGVDIDSFS